MGVWSKALPLTASCLTTARVQFSFEEPGAITLLDSYKPHSLKGKLYGNGYPE